jgi:glycosyltransferase involved in cell wall biosynthesis
LQAIAHERQCRIASAACGLTFLKGRSTVARYRQYAQSIFPFEDTSYLSSEIISPETVNNRLASLLQNSRPLRLVYCGRLVDIKGLDRSINIIHKSLAMGANVTLDIIGGGPEEYSLKQLSASLGITNKVTFLGTMTYGPSLINKLSEFDALFFNPRMQETPRMIFDGYAAGLPLISDGIDYVLERSDSDRAVIVLTRNDDESAADKLYELDKNREKLISYTKNALEAANYHSADNWYARRAEATHKMVEQHKHRNKIK